MARSRNRRGWRDRRAHAEDSSQYQDNTGSEVSHSMHRKDGQIIAQVHRALEHVLRERPGPALMVLAIDPLPDARRLLITLCPFAPSAQPVPDGDAILPALKWELARRLSRKRLPELRVVVLPAAPVWKEYPDA